MNKANNQIPGSYQPETAEWCNAIACKYVLEDHHMFLLRICGEAWDKGQAARARWQEEGLTVVDKYGTMKPHPCTLIEHQAKIEFMRAARQLGLDEAELPKQPPVLQPRRINRG